jgi:hypothetical protein
MKRMPPASCLACTTTITCLMFEAAT